MNTEELFAITKNLIPLVARTASITLPYFDAYVHHKTSFETKADKSPVTKADIETELWLRETLRKAYPDFGIIGEEIAPHKPHARYVWIIDPIDGTRTFIHGVPLYTTLVGLLDTHSFTPLVGCIYAPATRELLYAYLGGGAHFLQISMDTMRSSCFDESMYKKSRAVQCDTKITKLQESLLLSYDWGRIIEKQPHALSLIKKTHITRTWADGYAYLLLSSSRAQAVIDMSMNLWDIAPVYAVVTEAGGIVSNVEGKMLDIRSLYEKHLASHTAKVDIISCANREIHNEILKCLLTEE